MKLGPHMYHLNTFLSDRNEDGSEWAAGWGIQKTVQKCYEINIISALTRPNNSLKNAMNLGFSLLSSSSIWLYL